MLVLVCSNGSRVRASTWAFGSRVWVDGMWHTSNSTWCAACRNCEFGPRCQKLHQKEYGDGEQMVERTQPGKMGKDRANVGKSATKGLRNDKAIGRGKAESMQLGMNRLPEGGLGGLNDCMSTIRGGQC